MESALDLMRRLPPQNVQENLSGLVDLAPHMTEEFLSRIDQPLLVAFDSVARRSFLLCDYNRDMDSYRSPWSNQYFPTLPDGDTPPAHLRRLEAHANEVFDAYREQYYEGGVSSVYLWELDDDEGVGGGGDGGGGGGGVGPTAEVGSFAGCFLIHKDGSKEGAGRKVGSASAPVGASFSFTRVSVFRTQSSSSSSHSLSVFGFHKKHSIFYS